MVIGIGVDLVEVMRISRLSLVPGFVGRFFHPAETEYAYARKSGFEETLAACFAAKEAFGKALGTGIRGFSLKDVEVSHDESGRPLLRLHGKATEFFAKSGGERVLLSLSHERSMACAFVVIEGPGEKTPAEVSYGRGIGE
jgi:holo-[acyl-carrier protein] synthase